MKENAYPQKSEILSSDSDRDALLPTKDVPPGLEDAYNNLMEIISVPFLYPDIVNNLQIECPKGVLYEISLLIVVILSNKLVLKACCYTDHQVLVKLCS